MTDDLPNPALLPTGLIDLLPPEAETEAQAVAALMDVFAAHGYERVKPPLVEFADGLLAGTGAPMAEQTFRLMDPDTHRMLGLRADMTPQIARIAHTRLGSRPRPLRLSYAGQCLRVRGSQIDPNRQVAQAGIELIGPDTPAADAEMVLLAAEALAALGLERLSFDLTLPTLARRLCSMMRGMHGRARAALVRALDRKDAAGVDGSMGVGSRRVADGAAAVGGAGGAGDGDVLEGAALGPASARALRARLRATVDAVRARGAGAAADAWIRWSSGGFGYHTGLCLTVYALGRAEELGRGGTVCVGGRHGAGDGGDAVSRM